MKRYLLFVWYIYYPDGGMNDFKEDSDSFDEWLEQSEKKLQIAPFDDCGCGAHVFDTKTDLIILEGLIKYGTESISGLDTWKWYWEKVNRPLDKEML